MCNRPRSATRFSFDFELQGMMICGAFTEIFKPIFAPCCWMYCTFVKRIRYQLLLSGNGKCYIRDLHIAWPLLPAVTLKKKKTKEDWIAAPFSFVVVFVCCLFVCLICVITWILWRYSSAFSFQKQQDKNQNSWVSSYELHWDNYHQAGTWNNRTRQTFWEFF